MKPPPDVVPFASFPKQRTRVVVFGIAPKVGMVENGRKAEEINEYDGHKAQEPPSPVAFFAHPGLILANSSRMPQCSRRGVGFLK